MEGVERRLTHSRLDGWFKSGYSLRQCRYQTFQKCVLDLSEMCRKVFGYKNQSENRSTGSSKINGAKFSDACSVRANWLCMGWPFCLAEMRREFQTGGKIFCTTLYIEHP